LNDLLKRVSCMAFSIAARSTDLRSVVSGRTAARRFTLTEAPRGPCALQCVALQLQCTQSENLSWTIRSRSLCPQRWVARSSTMKQTMDRRRLAFGIAAWVCAALTTTPAAAQTIQGRWNLLAAEDLRADGSVARYPWGRRPVGSIVVDSGWCYIQIMSSDTPSFGAKAATSVGEQMKSALLSTYIAYSGTCATDDAAGTVVLKVEAAWRPDYVGTEQRRFYRFENGRLLFGPAPNSIRSGEERWTRRLTLERVP
jgi:hypothetical protein